MNKQKQKQLIIDIMNEDAKDGLYKQQTAIEWFNEEINKLNVGTDARVFIAKLFEQAKEMEREQIIEACNSQKNDYRGMPTYNKSGEQYYNKTYGGNK
jgi:hypothetical protein